MLESIDLSSAHVDLLNTIAFEVVGYYKWGPWVNGGAWIQTPTGKLDLLYRNIQQVQRVIDESQEGSCQHDYYPKVRSPRLKIPTGARR